MIDRFNRLAHRLKEGDRRAGEEIFNSFSRQIFRFFMVKTGSRETAEDLTQEVFLKLIDKIKTFNENLGSFSGWFWQIAKNSAKDYYRKKKPVAMTDILLQNKENSDFLAGKNDPKAALEVEEIMDLLKDFDEEEQEIFSLHYLSDMPYRQIAKITGRSESSLRVLVHRVNKKIRKLFNNV
jgi:RNA polymerase sigma-70 factor (ECF subfamily)